MNEVEFYLEDLKSKFAKINPAEYYLAYSGGRDSHFLLWFIREYLHETRIPAVFSNTGMEIPEIRDRALANADVVLKPAMKHAEIKEKYGIPLNTKTSDDWVYRYQTLRAKGVEEKDMPNYLKFMAMRDVTATPRGRKTGMLSMMCVNKKTSDAMRAGRLHKVSHLCCEYLKKRPAMLYRERERERVGFAPKSIIGVMGMESIKRAAVYKSCFSKDMTFHPLWDLTEELQKKIEAYCGIPVPKIYQYVNQTGCAGCPYGQHGKDRFFTTNLDLNLCHEGQRKFILEYFKESYEFKGYEFRPMIFQAEGIYGK